MKDASKIIITPLITEKNNDSAAQDKYVFKVDPRAGKIEIGRAVEALFEVKVKSVNVMNYNGKPKRTGRTMKIGRRANWKKAVVTLKEGSINLF
ncbi:MAG: 50S ribosomal protein L23 [Victivallaceae bacterium]|nr:50S ribosomal protein L23 [Victivallaceae bacterium]